MKKAFAKGGSNLTEFARISGMSADEFSTAWKTNAMSALTAFIHGLGQLDEDGESTVLVLEELGLSGIRQSNMLKSLALAADKMTSAVDTANTAWEENVALTNEANKRYGTAQSQLIMMQNAYKNVQAAIGDAYNPTLKSLYALLTDILTSVEGFISKNPELVRGVTALTGTFLSLASALAVVAAAVKAFKLLNLAALFTGPTGAILGTVAAVSALVGGSAAFTGATENEAEAKTKAEKYLRLHNKYAKTASFTLPGNRTSWPALRPRSPAGARGTENTSSSRLRIRSARPATPRRSSCVRHWRVTDESY